MSGCSGSRWRPTDEDDIEAAAAPEAPAEPSIPVAAPLPPMGPDVPIVPPGATMVYASDPAEPEPEPEPAPAAAPDVVVLMWDGREFDLEGQTIDGDRPLERVRHRGRRSQCVASPRRGPPHGAGFLARRPGVDEWHRGEWAAGYGDVAHERRRDRGGDDPDHVRAPHWLSNSCSRSRSRSSSSSTCSSGG